MLNAHLQSTGRDLEIFTNVVAVKHGIDIVQVDLLVSEMPTLLYNC